jgi:hypothetical protein
MSAEDRDALRAAARWLEQPGFAARLAAMLGRPLELIGQALPASAAQAISAAATKGLELALDVALRTLPHESHPEQRRMHRLLAAASGAAGGAFGLATLPVELPLSTIIMLRSIAAIARREGEDLSDPEAALACVQVFALGGRAVSDDASEIGYFAARAMLARSVTEAARFVAERGLVKEGAPVLVRFIALVSSRYGLVVTQKAAAQAVPVVGALGGAAVNYAFVQHFQDIAQGHFTVRRLERLYGEGLVRAEYERIAEDYRST